MTTYGPLDLGESTEPVKVKTRERDGRVCICGHSAGAHAPMSQFGVDVATVPAGGVRCATGRQDCPCVQFQHVLTSSDVRPFKGRTYGFGIDHALGRGVSRASVHGAVLDWVEGLRCAKCQTETTGLAPVAMTEHGTISRKPSRGNFLLCRVCRDGIEVEPETPQWVDKG